jgi:hypothetical protein
MRQAGDHLSPPVAEKMTYQTAYLRLGLRLDFRLSLHGRDRKSQAFHLLDNPDLDRTVLFQSRTTFGQFDRTLEVSRREKDVAANFFFSFEEGAVGDSLTFLTREDFASNLQWVAPFKMAFAFEVIKPAKPGVHVALHLLRLHLLRVSAAAEDVEELVRLFFHVNLSS